MRRIPRKLNIKANWDNEVDINLWLMSDNSKSEYGKNSLTKSIKIESLDDKGETTNDNARKAENWKRNC